MDDIWSILGAIGSVLGAFFAWMQFKKAKSSAEQATNIEFRLTNLLLKQREMAKEVQKIKTLINKLSNYVHPGTNKDNIVGLVLDSLINDVMQVILDLKSTSPHSENFKEPINNIINIITSTDFKKSGENERINAVTELLNYLSKISSEMDNEVKKDD